MLANARHPVFPIVQQVFLQPQPNPLPEIIIGKLLGYPLPEGPATICYHEGVGGWGGVGGGGGVVGGVANNRVSMPRKGRF